MMWKNEVYRQLRSQHLFENEAHQSRFKELLDCYSQAGFSLQVYVSVCTFPVGTRNTLLSSWIC